MITIVVNGRKTDKIYLELKLRYKTAKYVKVISSSDMEKADETELYLFVGEDKKIDTNVLHVDFSDSKLLPHVNKKHTIEELRVLLLDGITEFVSADQIIGMDLHDLLCAMQGCTDINICVIDSKEILEKNWDIGTVLTKMQLDTDECNAAYLYFRGIAQLLEAADIAEEICHAIGKKYTIYTARYDETYEDSYCIVALFFCQ